jgi:DNA-binding SARP family transcriptional activator/predicted ATPase
MRDHDMIDNKPTAYLCVTEQPPSSARHNAGKEVTMSTLKLYLLGAPRLEVNGKPVELSRRKALALLAYLAVRGEPQRRDTLATLFWPDSPQAHARADLRRDLSVLSETLGVAWLAVERETVALPRTPALWIDVEHFQQLAQTQSDLVALSTAVDLYRDDFLAGFTLTGCPAFDDWQFFEAESLRQSLAGALQRLIAGYVAQGAALIAIPHARQWLALDPLHEPAHCQLMQLYAQSGQQAAAVRQYQLCCEILDKEMGVEPAAETTALYEQIRAGNLRITNYDLRESMPDEQLLVNRKPVVEPSQIVNRHNLPAQPTPFVGRAAEMVAITRTLGDPGCRLLTLVGPGGIGKTRLALQLAQTILDYGDRGRTFEILDSKPSPTKNGPKSKIQNLKFQHGIFFVPLAAVSTPSAVVSAIASAMNFTFYSNVPPRYHLLAYLQEKAVLLVLDNFEHLLLSSQPSSSPGEGDAGELIAEILATGPAVKMLITSREALNLQEAWFYPVEGLPLPEQASADEAQVESSDAIRFFVQCAQRARSGFALAAERTDVVRICQLVEGMPLGIELAAAWLKTLSCAAVAGEIERNLDFLSSRLRNLPERHRSMRAVFEHSWHLLSADERAVLKRLAILRGFRQEAAKTVAGASLFTLATLVEKSLVRTTQESAGTGRYQMHELLRQFAEEKLQEDAAEASETQARHSVYYLGFVQTRASALRGPQQPRALLEIGEEIENVRAGWNWAAAHGVVDSIDQAVVGLYEFFQIRSRYQEGAEIFEQAAHALQQTNNTGELSEHPALTIPVQRLLNRLGAFYSYLGQFTLAQTLIQQGLTMAQTLDLPAEAAFCLLLLGDMTAWQGQHQAAYQLLQASLTISRALQDQRSIAYTLGRLAESLVSWGNYAETKTLAQESLAISQQSGRMDQAALAQRMLGYATAMLGEYQAAERHFQESLRNFSEVDDRLGMAMALGGFAWLAGMAMSGEPSAARVHAERSLVLVRASGHRVLTAAILYIIAYLYIRLNEDEQAEQYFQEGLITARLVGVAALLVGCNSGLGYLAYRHGDLVASRRALLEALQASRLGHVPANALEAVVYYATLLSAECKVIPAQRMNGKQTQAIELLTLACDHPATWHFLKDKAALLLAELATELPPEVVAAAQTRGQQLTLDAAIEAILCDA